MENDVKILLVENHTIVREGLRTLLEDKGYAVIGEAEDGRTGAQMASELDPDVIVMDISLPLLSGIEATRRIHKEKPEVKIIMLTIHDEETYIYKSLEAGASGYLVKDTASKDLLDAIDAVLGGGLYLSPNFPPEYLDTYMKMVRSGKKADDFSRLTNREREILQAIAEGYTSKQIAEQLFISVKTVENHRANIMNKLNIHDTASLVRYAIKIGLVES
jgi:two-component system response regulator NreC